MSDSASSRDIEGFSSLENTKFRVVEYYLRLGMDMTYACYMANISPHTMANWTREGINKPDSKYAALLTRFRQAVGNLEGALLKELNLTHVTGRKAEYEDRLIKETTMPDGSVVRDYMPVKVKDEIKPDAKAAQWLLSRRFKQKWGDSLDINLTRDILTDEAQKIKDVEKPRSTEDEIAQLEHYVAQLKVIADEENNA